MGVKNRSSAPSLLERGSREVVGWNPTHLDQSCGTLRKLPFGNGIGHLRRVESGAPHGIHTGVGRDLMPSCNRFEITDGSHTKAYLLRLSYTMFIPQMSVRPHCENTPIFVS